MINSEKIDIEEEYQLFDIQRELEKESEISISFSDIVTDLISGDIKKVAKNIAEEIFRQIGKECRTNQKMIAELMILSIMAAFFSNFSNVFFSHQVGETGFFAAYLLMFTMILSSFFLMSSIVSDVMEKLLSFMRVLIPSYSLAITASTGLTTSLATYEFFMIIISICEWITLKGIIPLIYMYMIMELANNMAKEDHFSKLTELIKRGSIQALKGVIGIVLGVNMIQSMILPATDSVKVNVIQKGLNAIPGAGQLLGTVTSTIVGSSVIIKNSIGGAGIFCLIIILSVPVLKVILFVLTYYIAAALLQPISDKRLIQCLYAAGESGKLLLNVLLSCGALFLLVIAMTAMSTNQKV
ncbi:MAG: stage III sporulation protein AE [Lachnospiraceae bacterium]